MNLAELLGLLMGAGGVSGALVTLVQAKSTRRKINADAAEVLVNASLKLNEPLTRQVEYLETKVRELQSLLDQERRASQARIDQLEMQLIEARRSR